MGEEALRALLDPEGWSLRDAVIVAASERVRGDPNAARAAVLDADLRAVGKPSLPRWAYGGAREAGAGVTGPKVLQVVDARDISTPKRAPGSSGRRMLRLDLTDGDAAVVAVEYGELTSIKDASSLAPGTKVAIAPGVRIPCQSGILLVQGDAMRVLGGRVAALAEEWEGRRASSESGAGPAAAGSGAGGIDAPRFETYDPEKAEETVAASIAGRVAANKAAAEAIAEKKAAAAAATSAKPEPKADSAEEEPAPFVPRQRPTLPPTRAQRAAARATGVELPPPGAPMPSATPETATGQAPDVAAPAFPPRNRPALPPKRDRADSTGARGPPPGFMPPAVPAEESTARVDPPPGPPAPAFVPTVTEEDRRSRLLNRLAPDPRGGRGGRDRGDRDRGRGDRDRDRGDRDRGGRGGRGGRGRRGGEEERDDGLRTADRHESGMRAEDDEALARQLQRELELEGSGGIAADGAALAASLFSFPARELEREDSGGRSGRR